MKTHRMTLLEGWPGSSAKVIYLYRGHKIIRTYRPHDVRNATHRGYFYAVQFADGKSMHGLSVLADAKGSIDRFVTANAESELSKEIIKRTFCGAPFLSGMTLEDLRQRRDLAVHDGDLKLAFALATQIDKAKGLY